MACEFRETQGQANTAVASAFTAPVGAATSTVATSGTAAEITGLTSGSMYRLWSDTNCFVRFTLGGTDAATLTDMPLTAELPEWVTLTDLDRISVITDGATGTLYATEMG